MKPTLIDHLDKKEILTEITNCCRRSGRFNSRTVLEELYPKHSYVYYEYIEANSKKLNNHASLFGFIVVTYQLPSS